MNKSRRMGLRRTIGRILGKGMRFLFMISPANHAFLYAFMHFFFVFAAEINHADNGYD